MYQHPMWVCDNCKFTMYHPITYCPKCPGRLRLQKLDIEHPDKFKTTEEMYSHLKQKGLDYHGEYPQFKDGVKIREGI